MPWHHTKIKLKSAPWDVASFTMTPVIKDLLHRMVKTCLLDAGVGLASAQIGVFKKLFIIQETEEDGRVFFRAYFNPSFTTISKDKEDDIEGCLSVPEGTYKVSRYTNILAKWWEWNEDAQKLEAHEKNLTGFQARVFQHEFQHTQGMTIHTFGIKV